MLRHKYLIPFMALAGILFCTALLAKTTKMEVIQLYNRPAVEVIPIVKPFMPQNTILRPDGYRLIVKTSPQGLATLKDMLKNIDIAPKNLLITLRRGEGQKQYKEEHVLNNIPLTQKQQRKKVNYSQSVRVMDGQAAMIQFGRKVPFAMTTASGATTTTLKPVTTGMYVTPRVMGKRVQLTLQTYTNKTQRGGNIRTQQVQTKIVIPMGEWVNLANFIGRHNADIQRILHGSIASGSNSQDLYIRVGPYKKP